MIKVTSLAWSMCFQPDGIYTKTFPDMLYLLCSCIRGWALTCTLCCSRPFCPSCGPDYLSEASFQPHALLSATPTYLSSDLYGHLFIVLDRCWLLGQVFTQSRRWRVTRMMMCPHKDRSWKGPQLSCFRTDGISGRQFDKATLSSQVDCYKAASRLCWPGFLGKMEQTWGPCAPVSHISYRPSKVWIHVCFPSLLQDASAMRFVKEIRAPTHLHPHVQQQVPAPTQHAYCTWCCRWKMLLGYKLSSTRAHLLLTHCI